MRCRDAVIGKNLEASARRVVNRKRLPDRSGRSGDLPLEAGEISLPPRSQRNRSRPYHPAPFAERVVVVKEERLAAADRPAQRASELVTPQRRLPVGGPGA